ncbi:MAG: hypothetical protein IJI68_00090 [Eggerthellaceae bacterium]|nr:hypothetical protein [Eggerthellaceae bacterium]
MSERECKIPPGAPSAKQLWQELMDMSFSNRLKGNERTAAFLKDVATKIESAVLSDTLVVRLFVSDAIHMYMELYRFAATEDDERLLKYKANVANSWLESNFWPTVPLTWCKEKEPLV